ncbi:MAG: aromatic ring-hydroxylating dioxygenase subunit alpha [Flavobacteriales bacterium]|nr:aromatic ring-hydroxylating dioxygenase subunit alpha [Flavobacteriales bacterium]
MINHNFSIDEDITQATTLPGALYSSPSFFEKTKDAIFTKCWHFVTDTDEVRVDGTIFPFVMSQGFLNEPLMITRTDEGLKCISNVCTHRGNILVATKQQNCKGITCCYHGKRFDLDGCFKSMPGFEEAKNFPTEADNLPQISLKEFGKLLFTSIKPAFSFEKSFGRILNRLDFLPHQNLKHYPELSRDYLVKANWMLYCENYLEGFHIPFVHPGLNATIDFGNYEYEIDKYFNLQIGIVKDGEETFEIPEKHQDFGKKVGAYYYWIFPNIMLNFYPWGLSINIVNPLEKELTKVKFLTYVWDESKFDKGAGSGLDKVEREDEEIVERVQLGVKSRLYKKGRYSPTMEKGTHHFHRLIADFLTE